MSINYVKGDATKPQGDGPKLIIHCCNTIGAWGAGFVMAVSRRWRRPEASYYDWWHKVDGPLPLGWIQPVKIVGEDLWVVNMIGQEGVGMTCGCTGEMQPPIRYEAIRTCLWKVAQYAKEKGATIHAPRFGAGLAGGDWTVIEKLIEEELIARDLSVTVYDYAG